MKLKRIYAFLAAGLLMGATLALADAIPTVSSHATPALVDEINVAIADIQSKVGTTGVSAASFGTNVAKYAAALTATGTVALVGQPISLTDTNGVTAAVWTNATATVSITVLNGGVVVTNLSLQTSVIR
jgi:hypothetical protein